jgi:cytochrome c553
MFRQTIALFAVVLAAAAGDARADAASGKTKARACAVCHGLLGVSVMPDTPHLAAQPAGYLAVQLKAFRSGKRIHEVMTVIAKPLADEDIADLAAWFSSLQLEVREGP